MKCYEEKDRTESEVSLTYLEEYVRKTGAEVRTIDIELLLSGEVNVVASRAIDFDPGS